MFALAACAGADDPATRKAALGVLNKVCRTGTHLFLFARYVEQFRGWGRGLRDAVANWYTAKDSHALAIQLVKYQQREGWSHRDLLRLSKPRPPRNSPTDRNLAWAVGKPFSENNYDTVLQAYEELHKGVTPKRAADLIEMFQVPWEAVPSEMLNDPKVLEALVPDMGAGALIRNLNRLTIAGLLKPMSTYNKVVIDKLTDADYIERSRVHPLNVLTAALTYSAGHGVKGDSKWTPVKQVVDALDTTFRLAFSNVVPADKRTMLCIDVSGSMTWGNIAGTFLTPNVASAAMALVTAATEPEYHIMGFCHELRNLNITAKSSLDQAVRATHDQSFGGTDCALPMYWSLKNNVQCDHFVVYTDSETWAGRGHPVQALREYRQRTGIPARLTVVGMVSNGFTIADPNDGGMLDVVGFDSAAPALISDFGAGRI
jgi:60 kDa SS-A/Ro ribonucleoprotein